VNYCIDPLTSNPEALHGNYEFYRANDASTARDEQRKYRRPTLPVLAIGGTEGSGEVPAGTLPRARRGSWRTRAGLRGSSPGSSVEVPNALVAALTALLTPYP